MSILKLQWITDAYNPIFTTTFKDYFSELGITLKEETKLWDEINKDMQMFDIKIFVLLDREQVIGFSMFQLDKEDNHWCLSVGAGDIREIYVKKEFRKKGYGTYMFKLIKNYFADLNIKEIYLTASKNDGEPFWIKQGFQDTGKINTKNKHREFVYFLS